MDFIFDSLIGSILSVLNIAKIIFPLMIGIEILKDLKIIDKVSKLTKPLTNFFTLDEKTNVPIAIGLILGLFFGAGVIIQSVKEDSLDKRDIMLICIFLSLCHAVFEDTIIFTAIGAKLIPILVARLIAAFGITYAISKYTNKCGIKN